MKNYIFFFFIILSLISYSQSIVINEIVSKNSSENSDWIEIYNPSLDTISLSGFYMSDDESNLVKWQFPNVSISPKDFLLIYASNNALPLVNSLQTNFKIKSEGEVIYLSNESKKIIDYFPAITLLENQSFGRYPDGSDFFGKLTSSSPSLPNQEIESAFTDIQFSKQAGIYQDSLRLIITPTYSDAKIFYTKDGSDPNSNSFEYKNSILLNPLNNQKNNFSSIPTAISWTEPRGDVNKGHILKVIAYLNGEPISDIFTKSYFVWENKNYNIPIVSIISDSINLFSNETGIYVQGNNTNFRQKGRNWERDANFEFFSKDGNLLHHQAIGIRLNGNKGRTIPQKSMQLYARTSYGAERFNFGFFDQKKQTTFKRIILRSASSNDWKNTLFKNELAQKVSSNLNFEHPASFPVIVFLNGEYWGIHHFSERTDEHYISDYRNIEEQEIDYLTSNAEVEKGSNENYLELQDFILNNDLKQTANYKYVCSQINISNFIDYNCAELFFSNTDWPNNNIKYWRQKKSGKWEWIFSDCDECFSYENYNLMNDFVNLNNYNRDFPEWSTFLMHNLLKNQQFKNEFRNRFIQLINSDFSTSNLMNEIEEMKKMYSPLVAEHSLRWNAPATVEDWNEAINGLYSFAAIRPSIINQQLKEYFQYPFNLYPNPTNGIITMEWSANFNGFKHIKIRSIDGKIVHRTDLKDINTLDLSFLKKGVYLSEITLINQVYFQKIIVY